MEGRITKLHVFSSRPVYDVNAAPSVGPTPRPLHTGHFGQTTRASMCASTQEGPSPSETADISIY